MSGFFKATLNSQKSYNFYFRKSVKEKIRIVLHKFLCGKKYDEKFEANLFFLQIHNNSRLTITSRPGAGGMGGEGKKVGVAKKGEVGSK